MRVRDGQYPDLITVVQMAERFWETTDYEVPFDQKDVTRLAARCMDSGLLVVLDDGEVRGFCAAVKAPCIANAAYTVVAEIAWWVDPGAREQGGGRLLLEGIESAARRAGGSMLSMMLLESDADRAAGIYQARGYRPAERTYMLEL